MEITLSIGRRTWHLSIPGLSRTWNLETPSTTRGLLARLGRAASFTYRDTEREAQGIREAAQRELSRLETERHAHPDLPYGGREAAA